MTKYYSSVKLSAERLKHIQSFMLYIPEDDPAYTKFLEYLVKEQEAERGVVHRPDEEDLENYFLKF